MAFQFIQESRATIRRRVGRHAYGRDHFGYGTVTAATSTTFTAPYISLLSDDGWQGRTAHIAVGTGAGQTRIVTASVSSTGVATITPAWATVPDVDSEIEVWPDQITPDDVNDAINTAIHIAITELGLDVAHTWTGASDITLETTYYRTLSVPSGCIKVSRIYYIPDGGPPVYYEPADSVDSNRPNHFIISPNGFYCQPAIPSDITDAQIFIQGYKLPALLAADDDDAELPSAYLVPMAAFLLEVGPAMGASLDPEDHAGRASNWLTQALRIADVAQEPYDPSTRIVRS